MGFITGMLGGGSTPGQDQQMAAIRGAGKDYQSYRQELAQAMMNALSSASTAYQGMNNALETRWGAPGPGVPKGYWDQQKKLHEEKQKPTPMGAALNNAASTGTVDHRTPAQKDPWGTAAGAVFDPAGLFTKGVGGLF